MNLRDVLIVPAGCLAAFGASFLHPGPVHAREVWQEYRPMIAKGLEYLAAKQHADGHWEGTDGKHPTAMTALAGMALLMNGETCNPVKDAFAGFMGAPAPASSENKYAARIKKAAGWLAEQSQPGGVIWSGHASENDRYMYGHGLATQFLSWAWMANCMGTRKASEVVSAAAKFSVRAQGAQGGWYRTSAAEGHNFDELLATVLQLQALEIGHFLVAPDPAHDRAVIAGQQYLRTALAKYDEKPSAKQDVGRRTEAAAGLVGLFSDLLRFPNERRFVQRDRDFCKKPVDYCRREMPKDRVVQFGQDELCYYFHAQSLFMQDTHPQDDYSWYRYRTPLFDQVRKAQNKDGSWPAGDGLGVGQVYSTAVWCIILQLDPDRFPLAEYRSAYVGY